MPAIFVDLAGFVNLCGPRFRPERTNKKTGRASKRAPLIRPTPRSIAHAALLLECHENASLQRVVIAAEVMIA